jgi:sulfite exporter TauE/SafE/copper chaperone CopZ
MKDQEKDNRLKVAIEGMHCRSCEILVERKFREIPGVRKVSVSSASGVAVIEHDAAVQPSLEKLQQAVKGDGYKVRNLKGDADNGADNGNGERPCLWELVAAFLMAGVVAWIVSRNWLSADSLVSDKSVGFWSALVVGLVAGVSSCMAVAGGLLLSSTAKFNERYGSSSTFGRLRPVFLFVGGRVVFYGLFGGLIGALGKVLVPGPAVTGALLLIAALFMVIMGLDMLKIAPSWLRRLIPSSPKSVAHKVMDMEKHDHWTAPFLLGAATFFIPCGFTQAFQVYALSAHSFSAGAVILFGFAIGTAPALIALGWLSGALKGSAGKTFLQFAGALVVIFGLMNMQNGLVLAGLYFGPPADPKTVGDIAPAGATYEQDLPPVVNGRQVIKMVVGGQTAAYEPDFFIVRAGVPVRWEIDQQTSSGCLSYVVSRQLGIQAPLKRGPNVVEFTPTKPGKYVFSCSMGMYTGTITVVSGK